MAMVPVQVPPGICKSSSDYASGKPMGAQRGLEVRGRYTDCNHVRFVAGFAEKIGGWLAYTGIAAMLDKPRAHKVWKDAAGLPALGIGTETHLYKFDGTTLTDISPLRSISTGTLGANPFTTTISLTTVAVADAAQNVANGDWVRFSGAATFNGVTIAGWYRVSGRSGAGYTVESAVAASGSGAGGGAAVVWLYPRVLLGAAPFATVVGSPTVTVTHAAHGAVTNDYVTFGGAAAVAGLTISGEYRLTRIDANSYTITASGNANATTTGGGSAVNVVYIVTMSALTTSAPVAYGVGPYGTGPYGYARSTFTTAYAGWTLDSYGSQLLGAPINGTIYVHNTLVGGRAYPLLNAPTNIMAMFVTGERFVVALGTSNSTMTMAWADQTDYTNWTSAPTNTALSGRSRQGGARFVSGLRVRSGVSLALSDGSVFQMTYTGDNFVYDTPSISDNTGTVSPWAAIVLGGVAYWMGDGEFWTWDGAVRALPSDDIRDFVFKDLNRPYISRCWAGVVRAKKEIWFSYPSLEGTDIDKYVIYHVDQQCWSIGEWRELAGSGVRTAWCDADLFSKPIASDIDGVLYQHETGTDDNGEILETDLEFSPVDIDNGYTNMDVFGFLADFMRISGDVALTVKTKMYPQDAATENNFTIEDDNTTAVLDFRADGKMAGFELISSVLGGDFRLGVPRFNIQPSGGRL